MGAALLAAGGLVTVTAYDIAKIASDERPSDFWAYSHAVIAPPLAFAAGYEAADEAELDAAAMFVAGWFAALGGFGIGSVAVDRQRSGGVGAAIGLAAASTEQATLTLLGYQRSFGGFVVQTLFASPAIPAGLYWASDSESTADVVGGLALAGIGSISLLHGFASRVDGKRHLARRLNPKHRPRLAMNCPESGRRTCTVALSGTW